MITIEDVISDLKEIERVIGDPEAAHSKEDDMHRAVLERIANDADISIDEARKLANEAIKSCLMVFERWCA